jgi:hypothetical protein
MKKLLKKYIFVFGICAIIQPQLFSTSSDTVEIITACLRGPAAYYEFKLRNDYSRSAYFKRAAIHAIRLINDCCTSGKNPSFSIVYDIASTGGSLIAGRVAFKQPDKASCLGDEYERLGKFGLPIIEMLCALARTQKISPMPERFYTNSNKLIANIGLDITRITQFVLIDSPSNSKMRKTIIIGFILMCAIAIYLEIRDFKDRPHYVQDNSPEAQRQRREFFEQCRREDARQQEQAPTIQEILDQIEEEVPGLNGKPTTQSHLDGCADCHSFANLLSGKCGHRLCSGCTLKNTRCPICKTVL